LAQQQNDDNKSELDLKDSTIKILSKRLEIVDPEFDQSVAYQYSECFTVGLEITALNSEISRLKGTNAHLNKMNKALELDVGKLKGKCEEINVVKKAGTVKIQNKKAGKTKNNEKIVSKDPEKIGPEGDEETKNLQQEHNDLKAIYNLAVKKNLRYEEQLMTIGKNNSDVTVQLYYE
jgi:hypothetical protein